MADDSGHCHSHVDALCESRPLCDPFFTREECKIRPHHSFRSRPFDHKFSAPVTIAHHDHVRIYGQNKIEIRVSPPSNTGFVLFPSAQLISKIVGGKSQARDSRRDVLFESRCLIEGILKSNPLRPGHPIAQGFPEKRMADDKR